MQDDIEADAGDASAEHEETFAEFMAGAIGADDLEDDGEDQDRSEEDGAPDPKATKAEESEGDSDEEEGSEEEPTDRRRETISRLSLKVTQRERELTAERSKVRELERRVQELSQSRKSPDSLIDVARSWVAERIGSTDAKAIDEALEDHLVDLNFERYADRLGDDPDVKRRREEMQVERRRRDERRELEARIERIERERLEAEARAQRAGVSTTVSRYLTDRSSEHEFLLAQTDVDPVETVVELAFEAVRRGQVQVATDEDAERLLTQIARNLDDHYRGLAESLSKKLRPAAGKSADDLDEVAEAPNRAKKQAPRKRTGATGTGGGGRGRATPQTRDEDDDEDSLSSFMRREAARENAARRRR